MSENDEIDEPYIYDEHGDQVTYKYPEKLIGHATGTVHYPACGNCVKQDEFIKTIGSCGLIESIYQMIYYHNGNLIVIKGIKDPEKCPKCLIMSNNHLYNINGEYLIYNTLYAEIDYTITVVPYGQILKNIKFPTVYETTNLGTIIELPGQIIVPKMPINNTIGDMMILADGRGIMLFATEVGEFILIDEYGNTVDCDTYPEVPNKLGNKIYGDKNTTIRIYWDLLGHNLYQVAECILHNKGKHTKAAVRT